MRISKEISGNALNRDVRERQGRGEYEWCDLSADDPSAQQLLGRRIAIRLTDSVIIDTGCIFGQQGGKQRVRKAVGQRGRLLYPSWHAAGVLMMPKPTRVEQSWGDGVPVMRAGQYGITHLFLGSVALDAANSAVIEIREIEAANCYQQDIVDFRARQGDVFRVWESKDQFDGEIRRLVAEHERYSSSGLPVAKELLEITAELQSQVAVAGWQYSIDPNTPTTDVLPSLLQIIGRSPTPPPGQFTEVPPEETAIRRREVKKWMRWAATRGAESARFRSAVRQAYD